MGSGADLAPSLSGGGPWLPPFPRRFPAALALPPCSSPTAAGSSTTRSSARCGRRAVARGLWPGRARRHPASRRRRSSRLPSGRSPRGSAVPAASRSGAGVGASLVPAAAAEALRSLSGRGVVGAGEPGCPFFFFLYTFLTIVLFAQTVNPVFCL